MPPRKNTSDTPGPIGLNLDTLEREGAAEQPFSFVVGGKRYIAADPMELEWQKLMRVAYNPPALFAELLDADEYKEFMGAKIPGWKLAKLGDALRDHYGIPSAGEADALPS